jgi:outer membrane protein
MKSFCLLAITLSLTSAASAADLKIGVVDVAKAFSEYYKTKDANAQLQENATKAKEELNDRLTAFKKLNDDAESLSKEAQDPVLSEQSRGKKRSELQSRVNEIRSLDKDIQEFRQRRSDQLQQENMQQRKGLYDEILKVITDKSRSDGYDLVFDKSGVSASLMPFLLFAKEGVTTDFTPELIVELNKNAPAAAASPKPEKASESNSAKKAPESGSTKKSSGKSK